MVTKGYNDVNSSSFCAAVVMAEESVKHGKCPRCQKILHWDYIGSYSDWTHCSESDSATAPAS